jgi:hypothetical protein
MFFFEGVLVFSRVIASYTSYSVGWGITFGFIASFLI